MTTIKDEFGPEDEVKIYAEYDKDFHHAIVYNYHEVNFHFYLIFGAVKLWRILIFGADLEKDFTRTSLFSEEFYSIYDAKSPLTPHFIEHNFRSFYW